MIAVNVKGGTGAGRKAPLKERRWTHHCTSIWRRWSQGIAGDRELTTYSCPDCGARRPT